MPMVMVLMITSRVRTLMVMEFSIRPILITMVMASPTVLKVLGTQIMMASQIIWILTQIMIVSMTAWKPASVATTLMVTV